MSNSPSNPSPRRLNGRCLCGAVHFSVEDAFLYAAYCHCSRCRGRTGSAFSAFGGIALDKLRLESSADQLLVTKGSRIGYSARCRVCHAPLYAAVAGDRVHVQLGALLDAPTRTPDQHIHVASKAAWYTIADDLPQFAELPPA